MWKLFKTEKRGGFSLMEILLAMAILMMGLMGVLALFPVAIDASGKAATATQCALLARSIKNALKLGMMNRMAVAGEEWVRVPFIHDGTIYGGQKREDISPIYNICLPITLTYDEFEPEPAHYSAWRKPRQDIICIPRVGNDRYGKPLVDLDGDGERDRVFRMLWTKDMRKNRTEYDFDQYTDFEVRHPFSEARTDPYRLFCFRIEAMPVVRPTDHDEDPATEPQLMEVKSLWEFTLYIYRGYAENAVIRFNPKTIIDEGQDPLYKYVMHISW